MSDGRASHLGDGCTHLFCNVRCDAILELLEGLIDVAHERLAAVLPGARHLEQHTWGWHRDRLAEDRDLRGHGRAAATSAGHGETCRSGREVLFIQDDSSINNMKAVERGEEVVRERLAFFF